MPLSFSQHASSQSGRSRLDHKCARTSRAWPLQSEQIWASICLQWSCCCFRTVVFNKAALSFYFERCLVVTTTRQGADGVRCMHFGFGRKIMPETGSSLRLGIIEKLNLQSCQFLEIDFVSVITMCTRRKLLLVGRIRRNFITTTVRDESQDTPQARHR